MCFFFFQAEDGIRDVAVTGVQTCALPILDTCSECRGTGALSGAQQVCTACGGTGHVTQTSGRMRFNITCQRCGGSGRLRTICRTCAGEGRVRRAETLEVRIPAGVQTGSRVRVPARGNTGPLGGPPGDLYIVTKVLP